VAGAVISALFFARVFGVTVLRSGLTSLGLTVWVIYTADHLIDAKKVRQMASTERHRFHQKHFSALLALLLLAIIIDAVQLFFIRKQVFIGGLILASIVVIYFALQRYLKFLKELIGALLYTGGVLLIPVSIMETPLTPSLIILIVQFVLTALTNLLLFSWFDRLRDEKDKHSSFTTVLGERITKRALVIVFVISLILMVVQLLNFDLKSVALIALMNSVLLVIFFDKKYFEKDDHYRLLGDAVFLLPLIYLLL